MMPPEPLPVQEPLLLIRRRPPVLVLPDDPSQEELAQYWTLSPQDKDEVAKCRGESQRRRFAVQLCTLRTYGRFLPKAVAAPVAITNYLARQLDLPLVLFGEIPERLATETDHWQRIQTYLGWQSFDDAHASAAPFAGTRSLAEAVGLAYAVARVLSASRALTPADLLVDMAGSGEAESMASTLAELSAWADALRTAFGNLKEAFTADPSQPDAWWRAALLVGPVDPAGSDATQTILASLTQRLAAYDAATQQHGQAAVHMTMTLARITALVGGDCTILPVFKAANAGELAACMADQATLLEGDLTRPQHWLQDYARVRASVEALDLTLTLGELYAGPTALTVGQLPLMPGQVWSGEHLPAHDISPRLSLVAHTPFPVAFSQDLAGLLVDAWSEVVPTATATTGLAFHYDEPRAQAPQALLLAVPPDLSRGWTFEDLEATVRETLDMARIRAVPAQRALYVTTWGGYLPALTLTHNLRQDLV